MDYTFNDIPDEYRELKELLKDKRIIDIIQKGSYYITVITCEDGFTIVYQDFTGVGAGAQRIILDTAEMNAIKKAAE